jgi:hypothetical protein
LLDADSGFEAGAGDCDEGIAGRDAAEGPFVEGKCVGVTQVVVEPLATDAAALEQSLRYLHPGEGLNLIAGKFFAPEAAPREGGVDYGKMASPLQFACKLEVVKDAKDSLNDSHLTL